MPNRNGRSSRTVTLGLGMGMDRVIITAAVAAAASVPSSLTCAAPGGQYPRRKEEIEQNDIQS